MSFLERYGTERGKLLDKSEDSFNFRPMASFLLIGIPLDLAMWNLVLKEGDLVVKLLETCDDLAKQLVNCLRGMSTPDVGAMWTDVLLRLTIRDVGGVAITGGTL